MCEEIKNLTLPERETERGVRSRFGALPGEGLCRRRPKAQGEIKPEGFEAGGDRADTSDRHTLSAEAGAGASPCAARSRKLLVVPELRASTSGGGPVLSSLGAGVVRPPVTHLLILPFDLLAKRAVVSSLDVC